MGIGGIVLGVIAMINNNKIIQNFYKSLELKGYKGKIVSTEHIPDLRKDIQKHHEQNLLDPEFYEEYKAYFEFEPEVDFPQIRSLFIHIFVRASINWPNNRISK